MKLYVKLAFLFLAVATTCFALPVTATQIISGKEESTKDPKSHVSYNQGYIINLNNVSIIEYLRFIAKITGKNFIFNEENLHFNVTVISEEAASVEFIMATLLQVLRANNLSLIEEGNNLLIVGEQGQQKVKQVPHVVTDANASDSQIPKEDAALVTRVFKLSNVNPTQLVAIIQNMISSNALVQASVETRQLIITDIHANVDRIAQLIQALDTPNSSLKIFQYRVSNTDPVAMVALAEKVLLPLAESNPMVMVPESSSGSIFLVSTPYLIEQASNIFSSLDIPTEKPLELPEGHIDNTSFTVYKLKYQQGGEIEKSLFDIGSSLNKSGITSMKLLDAIGSVKWIPSTNSLIISGDKQTLNKVEELIDTLDRPLEQVYIEVLIIDTSISNSLSFGIQGEMRENLTSATKGGFSSGTGFQYQTQAPTLDSAVSTANLGSVPSAAGLLNQPGFNLGVIGRWLIHGGTRYGSMGALLQALYTDTQTNIIMSPQIIALDNTAAEVFVGEEVQFQTSALVEGSSSGGSSNIVAQNFAYQEVGTKLRVLPIVSHTSDLITLQIEQTISSTEHLQQGGSGGSSNNAGPQKIRKATTKTHVQVPDGHFIVLSGMIKENKRKYTNRVPCLGALPVLGSLFKFDSDTDNKSNIMIFIRPHKISSTEQAQSITTRAKRILKEKSDLRPTKNEVDGLLEFLNLRGK